MNILSRFKPITCFVLDVDGVLTDGSLLVMPEGLLVRRMNIKDGYALQLAIKNKYRILVISGGNSPEVVNRLLKLGVTDVEMQVTDKEAVLDAYLKKNSISTDAVLYMGDDMPDFKVMQMAGLACCPADAVDDIKGISQYISPVKGGEGCVRDVIQKVMKLNGHWLIDTQIKAQ